MKFHTLKKIVIKDLIKNKLITRSFQVITLDIIKPETWIDMIISCVNINKRQKGNA